MTGRRPRNRVREHHTALGLTQAELAERAGISRTAITAIEGERLVPSVTTALAIAEVLGGTVEEFFGRRPVSWPTEVWAWQPSGSPLGCWRADVSDQTVLYPATSTPMLTQLPDSVMIAGSKHLSASFAPRHIASCSANSPAMTRQKLEVSGERTDVDVCRRR